MEGFLAMKSISSGSITSLNVFTMRNRDSLNARHISNLQTIAESMPAEPRDAENLNGRAIRRVRARVPAKAAADRSTMAVIST